MLLNLWAVNFCQNFHQKKVNFLQELFTQMQIRNFKKKPRTKYFLRPRSGAPSRPWLRIISEMLTILYALIQTTFTTTTTKSLKARSTVKFALVQENRNWLVEKNLAHVLGKVLEKAENLKGPAIEIWNKMCDSTQQETWFWTLVYLGKKPCSFKLRYSQIVGSLNQNL